MKHLCVAFLCLNCMFTVYCQELSDKRGYIGLSLGPALPIGSLASKDVANNDAGFAKSGLQISLIDFYFLFSKNFGIAANWSGIAFPIDDVQLGTRAGRILGDQVTVTSDPIAMGIFGFGPLYSRLINDETRLDVRLLFGWYSGILPNQIVETSRIRESITESTANSLGYGLGIGIRRDLGEKVSLKMSLDFNSATFEFELDEGPYQQNMTSVSLTIGAGFKLK